MDRRNSKELALADITARIDRLRAEYEAGFRAGFWWGSLTGSAITGALGFLGWVLL